MFAELPLLTSLQLEYRVAFMPNILKITDGKWLEQKYCVEKLTYTEIAKLANCTEGTIFNAMRRFKFIPRSRGHGKRIWDQNFLPEEVKPYFMERSDARWLACVFDCEGWIGMIRFRGKRTANHPCYRIGMTVYNTNKGLIDECHRIAKIGIIVTRKRKNPKHKDTYGLVIERFDEARRLLAALRPYLIIKKKQAELILSLAPKGYETPFLKAEIYRKMRVLNATGPIPWTDTL